jgi:hypothetical protein
MSKLRCIHIEALILAASLWLLCFSTGAVAGDRTYCVSTKDEFYAAMNYWKTSSDDNVIIDLVQGTYSLDPSSGNFDQAHAGGSAALVMTGGFVLSDADCAPGPINGANTVLDGANATDFDLTANGNVTIQGLTVQRMLGNPSAGFTTAFLIDSYGNGVSLKDVIVHDNTSAAIPRNVATYISATGGVLIADSLFYNDGCSGDVLGCSALEFGAFSGNFNVEIINTTIASNSTLGIVADDNAIVSMVNDILWNNTGGDIQVNSGGSLNISYSDYNTISNSGSFTAGSGNIHTDPLFNSDYSLQLSPTRSPAINAGATQATVGLLNGYTYPARDLANKQRVVGSLVDLGPYESSYDDQHNQVVTNTATSGAGSLYEAITTANAHPGASHITFNIPGSCPQIIVLANPLPQPNYPLFIDGTSQPGWVANSEYGAFNGTVCIVLTTGDNQAYALDAASAVSHLTVSGLGFAGFSDAAIRLEGGSGHVISGNVFTGGSFVLAPNNDGVRVTGTATNTLIGGYDDASTNVFINGTGAGIHIDNAAGGSAISYNLIGVSEDGHSAAGNATGISIYNSPGNVIRQNVIGNSASAGIILAGPSTSANILQGNLIGATANASVNEPNQQAGVLVQQGANNNSIGAISATDTEGGNFINHNGGPGVWISPSSGSGNSVLANLLENDGGASFSDGLAIDLGALGPDPNICTPAATCTPATSGPNDMQDFPVSLYSVLASTGPIVGGTLDAAPSSTYRLDFYYSSYTPAGHPGRGNAGVFYGTSLVTTDSNGHSNFSAAVSLVDAIATGGWSSATATSLVGTFSVPQNTSEIGNAVQVIADEIFKDGFGN